MVVEKNHEDRLLALPGRQARPACKEAGIRHQENQAARLQGCKAKAKAKAYFLRYLYREAFLQAYREAKSYSCRKVARRSSTKGVDTRPVSRAFPFPSHQGHHHPAFITRRPSSIGLASAVLVSSV